MKNTEIFNDKNTCHTVTDKDLVNDVSLSSYCQITIIIRLKHTNIVYNIMYNNKYKEIQHP